MNFARNLLVAVLLVATPFAAQAKSPDVSEFTWLIKWFRTYPGHHADEEEARQIAFLQHVIPLIPDYGSSSSLEAAIEPFLRDHDILDVLIVNSKTTQLFGKSKDEVFFIQDQNGKMRYVVKAFRDPAALAGKFIPELSALSLIQERQMEHLKTVQPLGIGKCVSAGISYGLLLETMAPGQRVDQFVEAISTCQKGSAERTGALRKAASMFSAMGRAFAELHDGDLTMITDFPKEPLIKMTQKLTVLDAPELQGKLEGKIDTQALKDYVHLLIQEVSQLKMKPSYQHGDPNLKNIFFEEESGQVIMIDVSKMHRSIDIEGNPLFDSAYDFVRIQESLLRKSLGLFSEKEVHKLIDSLYTGYRTHGGIAEECLIRFYTIYSKVSRLSNYRDFDKIQDPAESERHRLTFENSLHYLQKTLTVTP